MMCIRMMRLLLGGLVLLGGVVGDGKLEMDIWHLESRANVAERKLHALETAYADSRATVARLAASMERSAAHGAQLENDVASLRAVVDALLAERRGDLAFASGVVGPGLAPSRTMGTATATVVISRPGTTTPGPVVPRGHEADSLAPAGDLRGTPYPP